MMTEKQIEDSLIAKLTDLKYIYRTDIKNKETLEQNFRKKFEALNRVNLSDAEFARLRDEIINPDVFVAAKTLRGRNTFMREDGTPLQYTLVNTKDWCKNEFEVVNQLRMNTDSSFHRYDVMLLMNGIPVVQIELKTLGVSTRQAMEQIVNYKNSDDNNDNELRITDEQNIAHQNSNASEELPTRPAMEQIIQHKNNKENGYTNSLLCFIQIFVVSNNHSTYYFANNNKEYFRFNADEQFLPIYQFANEKNEKITRLEAFAEAFLAKCTLGEIISKYMVLVATEKKLLLMRPYQIYAVKAIVDCIHQNRGNGYIWHTTGSGKTLTSFKASTLLKDNPDIEKCLFVVDRKDLDRQTREEFNKFQEGCVEENTNTAALVERLLSEDYADKVIVTTIQKLSIALDSNNKNYQTQLKPLSNKRVVFIFDECHRSQFGDNHKAIKNFFPKAQLFGFTGTPIFEENATYIKIDGEKASYKTTKDIFEKQLHAYTITNAIDDKNVLRFHIEYYKIDSKNAPKKGEPAMRQTVVDAILKKHDAATHSRSFNAILATSSINEAIDYYKLFKETQAKQQAENKAFKPLNIACVFSPPAEGNKDIAQIQEDLPQEKIDNAQDPETKKTALTEIIADYNKQYKTNHRLIDFDLYYKDVQQRVKYQKYPNKDYAHSNKIDVLIVVDMLLTGFDSPYLNTLYVDKDLKYHGLVQAFSRTNRILNDSKPYGNILDFRQQEAAVDEAIKLFSGKDADQAKAIWIVEPAEKMVEKYEKAIGKLQQFMDLQDLECRPEQVNNLKGDMAKAQFIHYFKEVQKVKTQLEQYTDLTDTQQKTMNNLLPPDDLCAFKAAYLDVVQRLKNSQDKKNKKNTDIVVQELDFQLVLFASAIIDYDYIIALIAKSTQPDATGTNPLDVVNMLMADANMMGQREDLKTYIEQLPKGKVMNVDDVKAGFEQFKAEKSSRQLSALAQKHSIDAAALQAFVAKVLDRMIFDGDALSDLFAPMELGWKARTQKELALVEELTPLLIHLAQGSEITGLSAYEDK